MKQTGQSAGFWRSHRSFFILLAIITVCATAGGLMLWQASDNLVAAQQKLGATNDQIAKDNLQQAKQIVAKRKAEQARKAKEAASAKAAAEAAAKAQNVAQTPPTAQTCHSNGPHMNPSRIDVIVNKQHCINPLTYTPPDLVTVDGATLSAKASTAFDSMYRAMAAAGVSIRVTSSFRSYESQVATYNYWVQVNGSAAAADTVSARPGYSEHQTGLSADLAAGSCALECFAGTAQYAWLQAHAADYGFVERYPAGLTSITGYSPEAWHWRYVGVAVAKDMKAKGVKTLEQYWGVSGGSY